MATVSYTTPSAADAGPLGTVADLGALIGRVARRVPQLADRAERAGGLLMAGKVHPRGADLFTVEGSNGARYAVDAANAGCECPDHLEGRAPSHNGRRYCKHLLAAMMLTRLTEQAIARDAERRVRVPLAGRLAV